MLTGQLAAAMGAGCITEHLTYGKCQGIANLRSYRRARIVIEI
jgi:hypothetical protein